MRETVGRFGRYILTGGSAAVVDIGVFALLHPSVLSVPAAAASSFALAAVLNYILTSRFVYHRRLSLRRLVNFVLFALIGLSINVGVTVAVAHFTIAPAVLAKVAGIGAAFMVNFWMNTVVVFREGARA